MKRLVHRRVQNGEIVIATAGVQTNPLPAHRAQANAIIHSVHDEPQLPQDEEARIVALVTSSRASSLLKTPNVRHFFDLLGFSEDARKEATETLVQVANKFHEECGMVDSKVKRWADTYRNAIVFTEADMCTAHPNHNKPLYVESIINGMPIRRTFIDDGSGVNLMPLSTLHALGIDKESQRHPMTINSFDNTGTRTLGCVMVNFKMGSIQEQTCFHVVDADVAYHVLVGRRWLHSHYLLPSTLHQCIKGHWNGKEVFIPATKAPFEKNEVRYAEASFFDEMAENGEGTLSRPLGVMLLRWEEYSEAG